jgi:hypothetical protein
MKKYKYHLVVSDSTVELESSLNDSGRNGYRVTKFEVKQKENSYGRTYCCLMEKEIEDGEL